MPDLNLNDDDSMEELPSEEPSQPEGEGSGEESTESTEEATEESTEESAMASRRDRGGEATRMIVILVVLAVLAGAVYMVNKLGIVKLWGSSEPTMAQMQDPAAQDQTPADDQSQQPAQDAGAAQQAAEQAAQQAAPPPQQQAAQSKPVETPKIEEKKPTEQPMKLLDPIQFPKRQRPTQTVTQQQPPAQKPAQVATTQQQAPPQKAETKPVQQQAAAPAKTTPAAQQPKQTTPPAQALPKVNMANLSDMKGTYTVQVYALRDKGNAETMVQRLADAGYPAFVEEINAKESTWYTVRVGKFPSAADAKKAIENFAQEIKMHHFIDKVRMTGN